MNKQQQPNHEQGFVSLVIGVILLVLVAVVVLFGVLNHKTGAHLKLSNGCKDTDMTIQPVTLPTINSPVTLQAKLTMGSQPVADERITFRLIATDSTGHKLQLLEGYGQTDSAGVATLKKPSGFADDAITLGSHPTISGYSATFDGPSAIKKNEPFYCGSHAIADLTLQR